jgi:hypothetical protein
VRRVDPDRPLRPRQPCVGAALGAVAVQYVHAEFHRTLPDMTDRREIAAADVPRHRNAGEAERENRRKLGERRVGAFPAARRIRDDADLMSAHCLAACKVADMPEQSADRSAQHVQNVEGVRHWPFTIC